MSGREWVGQKNFGKIGKNKVPAKTGSGISNGQVYNRRMTSATHLLADKYPVARDAGPSAIGPRTEEEQKLLALIDEGLQSGPAIDITIDELASQLRERIRNKTA